MSALTRVLILLEGVEVNKHFILGSKYVYGIQKSVFTLNVTGFV